ncbi:MAG: ParA family protein [Planctomycetia bacterium]|nr:ParA family protein [Planctomycetia bacterium]
MPIIAVANQKGGTAKTTTAAAVGLLMARAGHDVHLIDMDPQASLTHAFGRREHEGRLFASLADATALPVERLDQRLTLTPSDITLSRGETEFMSRPARELCLRRALAATALAENCIVLIDCPPSLGVLAVNCLTAARQILLVIQPGGFELHALVHFEQTVTLLKEWVNPELSVAGAVLTNCHSRRTITEQVAGEVRRVYPLLGCVRMDAQLLYATTAGNIVGLHKSKALSDYDGVRINLEQRISWPNRPSAESQASWVG